MGLLEQGVSWIRGKLEGKAEVGATLVSRIAVGTVIVSTIIALFALFKFILKFGQFDPHFGWIFKGQEIFLQVSHPTELSEK